MMWTLLLAYLCLLVVLISPVLLVRRVRVRLRRWELLVVGYPLLVWIVLTAIGLRPKGMTNAYVELVLLAVGVLVILSLRLRLGAAIGSRRAALLMPAAACLWAAAIAIGVPGFSHYDLVRARSYVRAHPGLSVPIRDAILRGVVVEEMSPEEAAVAAGPYVWETEDGRLTRLTFGNLSQFGTDHPVGFNAYIVDGRVHEIERLHDLEECRDFVTNPPAERTEYPFAGFWKKDCTENFGLRFEPAGSGRYAVRFCGPGGCMDASQLSDCTPIPEGRYYTVIDNDTVVRRRGREESTYRRCGA